LRRKSGSFAAALKKADQALVIGSFSALADKTCKG
jgi:hypothetical protein